MFSNLHHTSPRVLSAIGDVYDPATWSGIPYHLLRAGLESGLFHEGLPLDPRGLRWGWRRLTWNGVRVLAGHGPGGFQYSNNFLEQLWSPHLRKCSGAWILNCFQLYPASITRDPSIQKWFFIDQTLSQLFDYYEERRNIGGRIAKDAIERERLGYQAASGIIAHSAWAAESLISDYKVPRERVHVVVPGASLDPSIYLRWEKEAAEYRMAIDQAESRDLQMVFVGKDWKRKGLDRLLSALEIVLRRGAKVALRVIGCSRQSLPGRLRNLPGVEWRGFMDKREDESRLIRLIAECDVGCLLSRAEAGGIVIREFHALGLAVLASATGGVADHVDPEASWLLDADVSEERVADKIFELARERALVFKAKEHAWRNRRRFAYGSVVRDIEELARRNSRCM